MVQVRVGVYVLSRDRQAFLLEAIKSIFAAGFTYEDVHISDNSLNRSVIRSVVKKYPAINYTLRGGELDPVTHIQCVLREFGSSKYDYAFIAHDDDLFLECSRSMIDSNIDKHPNAHAISFDGFNFRSGLRESLHGGNKDPCLPSLVTKSQVLTYQFNFLHQAINPFPAILYKRTCARRLLEVPNVGKYTDVAYMLALAEIGLAIVIDPIIDYRIHSGAGRLKYSRRDSLRLYRHIKHQAGIEEASRAIADYRWRIHLRRALDRPSRLWSRRISLAHLIFLIVGGIRYLVGVIKRCAT